MIAGALTPDQQKLEDRALAREIFHDLSQPLTALHCGLELALYRDQSLERLRGDVERALEIADCLRERLTLVRALDDACDPGDDSQRTDFSDLMRELREDLLPLFESAGNQLQLEIRCKAIVVRGERRRLMRALACFFMYLARYSSKNSVTAIRLDSVAGDQAELKILAQAFFPQSAHAGVDLPRSSCEAAMARRTFRALDGDFVMLSMDAGQSAWRATLPLA